MLSPNRRRESVAGSIKDSYPRPTMAIAAQSAHRVQAQNAQSAGGLLLASLVCDWRSRSRSPSGLVILGPTVELGGGRRCGGIPAGGSRGGAASVGREARAHSTSQFSATFSCANTKLRL